MDKAPKKLAEKTFSADLFSEGSWGSRSLGRHESTMTMYASDRPGRAWIEWDIPAIDGYEEIGLDFDVRGRLIDYEGVFSLPREAIALIRSVGFHVPREFE